MIPVDTSRDAIPRSSGHRDGVVVSVASIPAKVVATGPDTPLFDSPVYSKSELLPCNKIHMEGNVHVGFYYFVFSFSVDASCVESAHPTIIIYVATQASY